MNTYLSLNNCLPLLCRRVNKIQILEGLCLKNHITQIILLFRPCNLFQRLKVFPFRQHPVGCLDGPLFPGGLVNVLVRGSASLGRLLDLFRTQYLRLVVTGKLYHLFFTTILDHEIRLAVLP